MPMLSPSDQKLLLTYRLQAWWFVLVKLHASAGGSDCGVAHQWHAAYRLQNAVTAPRTSEVVGLYDVTLDFMHDFVWCPAVFICLASHICALLGSTMLIRFISGNVNITVDDLTEMWATCLQWQLLRSFFPTSCPLGLFSPADTEWWSLRGSCTEVRCYKSHLNVDQTSHYKRGPDVSWKTPCLVHTSE